MADDGSDWEGPNPEPLGSKGFPLGLPREGFPPHTSCILQQSDAQPIRGLREGQGKIEFWVWGLQKWGRAPHSKVEEERKTGGR
jgi:hypothetical protein